MKRKIVVIAALAAVCMLCVSFAACGEEYSGGYMSCLKSDAKLGEIVMLGAHDAGTVGQNDTACTQHSDFAEMLDGGVRYFDCRVTDVNGEPSFVHGNTDSFFWPSPKHMTLVEACDDIVAFVAKYPSEVIVLDFQHTWDATEDKVIAILEQKLGSIALDKTLAAVPSEVTLGQMREWGKNVVIVYRTPEKCEQKDFLYEREEYLQSEYNRGIHSISKNKYEEKYPLLIAEWDKYISGKSEGKLFVLQSQITATNWLAEAEAKFRPIANDWLAGLEKAENADKLAAINIVMRDFVADDDIGSERASDEVFKIVVKLNAAKGLVDPGLKDALFKGENIA
ncbi:MAG TPA: hypothetical protein IAB15_00780 [Candidatus Ornithoclostridium faecigallinarum]|nr:hypothetical protein [Candidatus Ornithoclostridium faecigallinarum]